MSERAIGANLVAVRSAIDAMRVQAGRSSAHVQLVAVSKTHPATAVRAAYAAGQRAFGENRVQELAGKARDLADLPGIEWHLIGSLQTNKVRDVLLVPGLQMVHSLDRQRLAVALQQELAPHGRLLDVLLQVNATDDGMKHGCRPDAAFELSTFVVQQCANLRLCGLMAMGPLEGDAEPVFRRVAALRSELQARLGLPLPHLSMGMSGDLRAAIRAGSTMVRVGTAVFGARD